MSFESDLERGRRIEIEFWKQLMRWWIQSVEFAPKGVFKDWDVRARFWKSWKLIEKTFEIKDDIISAQTWNVWFEYRCFGKPSWIYSSKADYIVYYLNEKFYYQERWELLYRLNMVDKKNVAWWDGNQSQMYIVSLQYLNNLFDEFK